MIKTAREGEERREVVVKRDQLMTMKANGARKAKVGTDGHRGCLAVGAMAIAVGGVWCACRRQI